MAKDVKDEFLFKFRLTKINSTHRHRKQIYGYQWGKGGNKLEVEINIYILPYIK